MFSDFTNVNLGLVQKKLISPRLEATTKLFWSDFEKLTYSNTSYDYGISFEYIISFNMM